MDLCALSTMHTSEGSIAQPTILLSMVSRVHTLLYFFVCFSKKTQETKARPRNFQVKKRLEKEFFELTTIVLSQ